MPNGDPFSGPVTWPTVVKMGGLLALFGAVASGLAINRLQIEANTRAINDARAEAAAGLAANAALDSANHAEEKKITDLYMQDRIRYCVGLAERRTPGHRDTAPEIPC